MDKPKFKKVGRRDKIHNPGNIYLIFRVSIE